MYLLEAGKAIGYDKQLKAGWRHLAAIRTGSQIQLLVDRVEVAESKNFEPAAYNLTPDMPLKIGFVQHDYFNGRMKDVRIYDRALPS